MRKPRRVRADGRPPLVLKDGAVAAKGVVKVRQVTPQPLDARSA